MPSFVVRKLHSGLTLIELMVVFAIISIGASFTFVSLWDQIGRKSLDTSAAEVVAVLQQTRNYALTGHVDSSLELVKDSLAPCVYTFSYSGSSYSVSSGSCGGIEVYQLPDSVGFRSGGEVRYFQPFGEYSSGPLGTSTTDTPVSIEIVLSSPVPHSVFVCIDSAGTVSLNGSSVCLFS
ncbi:MAG: prepilin-type N-terminal cleavage/methylation domain-containing protein [Candidatus Moranbacteria bacterium]|nr:prepilin-type N-terminal cleavage/methylation domain-containing protein [Candidatus Moranbacteria bacterium]